MVFCNKEYNTLQDLKKLVTILILVDGFLQFVNEGIIEENIKMSQSLF